MEVFSYLAGAILGPAVGAFFFFRWRQAQPGYSVFEGAVTVVLLTGILVGYALLMSRGEAALTGRGQSDWLDGAGVVAMFLGLFLLPALAGLLLGHLSSLLVKWLRPRISR